jgi:hypothetical protein
MLWGDLSMSRFQFKFVLRPASFAAWLARRIGLVNTMVYTHIPSSLCLIVAALSPSLELALTLLLVTNPLKMLPPPQKHVANVAKLVFFYSSSVLQSWLKFTEVPVQPLEKHDCKCLPNRTNSALILAG